MILLLFPPGVIRTMRDGIVIGAIGGLSFAANEFATSFALVNYPQLGWAALLTDLPARWALGTEMHIIWGATTGGAIGYAVEARDKVCRILIPLFVSAPVVMTHNVQDWMGKCIAPLYIAALKPILGDF